MNIQQILKCFLGALFCFFFINTTLKAQNPNSSETNVIKIENQLNHANTHFWLGRYWKNSLKEFQIAENYVDSAESILKSSPVDTINLKNFAIRILNYKNEIAEIKGICQDNMNGRFPLFMSLMGEIDNYEFIDEPIEISCENAIDNLLKLNTIKPSKPLADLMTYSIIEVVPYNATLEEVCAQYINNNSNTYVVSRHELSQIIKNNKIVYNSEDYKKVGQFYGVANIGKYTITINDQVDKINYVAATFDYFNPSSGNVISHTLGEGLVVDKVEITVLGFLKEALIFIFIFLIITIPFNCTLQRAFFKKEKWPATKKIFTLFLTSSFGVFTAAISSFALIFLAELYSPNSDDFYLSLESQIWIISTPLILGCLSPFISVLLAGLIFKKKILDNKLSVITLFQGAFLGGIFPILFHYFILNEVFSSIEMFLGFALIAFFSSIFSGSSYYKYEINPGKKRHIVFSLIHTLPIVLFSFCLLKNQDSITTFQISYVALSYAPTILIEKYWIKIIDFFKSNKSDTTNSIPGKIGEFDKVLNATLACEENSIKINFKENVKTALLDAVKSDHDQPKIGFQKGSNKINILHIKGPKGIGKSTLLKKELSAKYKDTYFYGDCDEFQDGNTIPYEPFVQAFGNVIGEGVFLSGDRSAKMVIEKLKPGIQETPLGNLALSMINTNSFSGASIKEICKVFEIFINKKVVSTGKPLLFVLEDTHWMDEDTHDLLLEFLKMIRILKKRIKFDFILILTERDSDQEPRLGSKKYQDLLTALKAEQHFNFKDLFKLKEEGSLLVEDDFCEKFLEDCGVEINFKTRQKISDGFIALGFNNPGHILESLKYIVSHNWLKEENGVLILKEEADFKNIPLPSQLKEMFAEKFAMLDDELKRILETASFIGETFEANILSEIWKIDRLTLLHKLRIAEESGFVKDLSDKDDVYKFSSKGIMSELRNYASKGSGKVDKPQLVKEYHRIITDIMLNKNQINPHTFDINIISQLADRTFFNRDQMHEKAFELNYITAERFLQKVNNKQTKEYIKRLEVLIEENNIALKDCIKTLILKQKVYLVDLSGGNFQEAISNANNLTRLLGQFSLEDDDFATFYETFFTDKLQLYFDSLRYFNDGIFKEEKPLHEAEIKSLCNSATPVIDSEKIHFTQRFYFIETFLYGNSEKIKSELELLRKDIEASHSKNNRIYGRVLNSLAICYERLNLNPDESKALWIKRLKLILEESNISLNDKSDLSIFKLISKNFSSLIFDLKKDVLYSAGAYSRFIFTNDENYELALDLSNSVKDMNLIVGDYRGYSTASSFISMCYNKLYEINTDSALFEKAFYFNEEVYYELENGYSLADGGVNYIDSISQFILFVNWMGLLSMKRDLSQKMKKSLSNAINDFTSIFTDGNGEISIVEKPYLKNYIESFKKFSESNILGGMEELKPIFEKIKFK
jgi:hypothetical protein